MTPPRSPFAEGRAAFDRGDFARAVGCFEAALEAAPENPVLLGHLGVALMQLGAYARAHEVLARAERLEPSSRLAFDRASLEIRLGRFEAALDALARAEARGHDPREVAVARAECLVQRGEGEAAQQMLEPLLAVSPKHPEALYWLAAAAATRRDQPEQLARAQAALTGLLGLRKGVTAWIRSRAHFLLASLYDDRAEGYAEAVKHYRAGLAIDETFARARNNLGSIFLAQGKAEEARAQLLEALLLDPGYPRPARSLARLYYGHLDEGSLEDDLRQVVARLEGESRVSALQGLALALMDEARREAFQVCYDRAHAFKNLLGLAGSRIRRLEKAPPRGAAVAPALASLRGQLDEIYAKLAADLHLLRPADAEGTEVDLNAVCRQVVRKCARQLGPGIELGLELEDDLPRLFGSQAPVEEAVLNLVRNAAEASGTTGAITLATRARRDRRLVELEVMDRGPGLPAGARDTIFSPGFTTKEGGSGLGLSIVRRTMNDMHGSVSAADRAGGGAVFTLRFPVQAATSQARKAGLSARPVQLGQAGDLDVDELA